jgi:SAM-dependent methyltransferase
MSHHQTELERIRAAYRERDRPAAAGAPATSPWLRADYRFYMQTLERQTLEALHAAGARLAGGRVLEVGCGGGYFLQRLTEYGASHGAGIDLMEPRIEAARERYPTLELVAGDASRLPWADGAFDVVVQYTCLSSILDPALRAEIAAEMSRVTGPGGVILSYDMRPLPWPFRVLGRLRARRRGPAAAPVTPTTAIGLDELRRHWAGHEIRASSATLTGELGMLAGRARWAAELAAAVPTLRTHLIVTARVPG